MKHRKYYEKCTNRKIPSDFHVHHINHDHSDNRIENLVAIPGDLHMSYHNLYFWFDTVNIRLTPSIHMGMKWINVWVPEEQLTELMEICKEISSWMLYREYLLWNFPCTNNSY